MAETKLLIIHQGSLGDFIATFPGILELKNRFRSIDALCQSALGKLANALHVADRWFAWESAIFASLYSALSYPADPMDLPPMDQPMGQPMDKIDQRVKKILTHYPDIVLFSYSRQLEQTITKLSEQRVHRIPPRAEAEKRIHTSRHIIDHLIACGLLKETDSAAPFNLPLCGLWGPENMPSGSPRVLIHPGSGSRKKNWPISNFIQIASALRSAGMKPEFILGPAEDFLKEALADARIAHRHIHIATDLVELVELLKTATGFIGNDSGVTHLSAFLGLPTVAVFGPSDPKRWKPAGRAVQVVRPRLSCRPCFEIEPDRCNDMRCFSRTSPEMVLSAFFELFKNQEAGSLPARRPAGGASEDRASNPDP